MMELLQKFAVVEIQADCRITKTDKEYCVQHQKAYEAAISSFQELAFFWENMNKAQQELLGDSKSPFFHNYLVSHGGPSISQVSINNHIEALHIDFIMTLTRYFNSTYHVSVSPAEVSKVLLPEKPSGRWQDDYVEVNKECQTQMQSLIVRYQDVVDQIILQLDGRSFSDQAFFELFSKCHSAAWTGSTQKPQFEQRKDTICFTGIFCRLKYVSSNIWELSNSMKDILRGLAHFETASYCVTPAEFQMEVFAPAGAYLQFPVVGVYRHRMGRGAGLSQVLVL